MKGTKTGEVLNGAMKDLMALKRPNAISFSKKNTVHPFESTESLEFWGGKNDATMFVVGQSTKKRPDGLTFVRMYDGHVLDMVEVGVENYVGLDEIKVSLSLLLANLRSLTTCTGKEICARTQAINAFCIGDICDESTDDAVQVYADVAVQRGRDY